MTRQFLKQVLTLMTASFGVIAALAWNSAIQGAIQRLYPTPIQGVRYQLVYALIITAITVFMTVWAGKIDKRLHLEEQREKRKADRK